MASSTENHAPTHVLRSIQNRTLQLREFRRKHSDTGPPMVSIRTRGEEISLTVNAPWPIKGRDGSCASILPPRP